MSAQPMPMEGCVVVHGLANAPLTMWLMARDLRRAGYDVENVSYPAAGPGARLGVARERAAAAAARLSARGRTTVHLVGFSMGGLTCRVLASGEPPQGARWGRVVLIAPPNSGSAFAGQLRRFLPVPAWNAMLPGLLDCLPEACAALPLPPPHVEVAVIAGVRETPRGYNPLTEGDDDLLVTLEEARLPGGSKDFRTVRATHGAMPMRRDVREAALNFIRTGRLAPVVEQEA